MLAGVTIYTNIVPSWLFLWGIVIGRFFVLVVVKYLADKTELDGCYAFSSNISPNVFPRLFVELRYGLPV